MLGINPVPRYRLDSGTLHSSIPHRTRLSCWATLQRILSSLLPTPTMPPAPLTPEQILLARKRIMRWPRYDRVALTDLTEPEVKLILELVATLDVRPVHE